MFANLCAEYYVVQIIKLNLDWCGWEADSLVAPAVVINQLEPGIQTTNKLNNNLHKIR